jgi:hypothetical protein
LQPSFFCSACGASNRTLAQYCRSCREPLAFETVLAHAHAGLEISPSVLTKGLRQVVLSRLNGCAITALASAWGHLVFAAQGWGLGVTANTSLNPARLLFHFEVEPDEEIRALHPLAPHEASPAILAVSHGAIYVLAGLPRFACKRLFRVSEPGWRIESTLCVRDQVVVRLYQAKARAYRWLVLEARSGATRELSLPTRGPMSAMIAAPEAEKFFFATEAEVVQYHLAAHKEQRHAGPELGLNIKTPPEIHPRTGEIFWLGLDGLIYRYNADASAKPLKTFGAQRYAVTHFFCSAYDDYLCALTPNNLVVLDYPGAAEVWNLAQHVQARISCSPRAPRPFGVYLMFAFRSSSTGNAEERVGLFSLTKREAPLLLHPGVAASPMPVAGVSHIVAVRKSESLAGRDKSALLLFQV